MTTTIKYGDSRVCRLSLDDSTRLAPDEQEHPPRADVAAEIVAALAAPTGYPPLAAAVVPGDRVAVAVESGLPQAARVIGGALRALTEAGVDRALITVVLPAKFRMREQLQRDLAAAGFDNVKLEVHDPHDADRNAMVGVASSGDPLRMNRALAEADFVLPVGLAEEPKRSQSRAAKFGGLFPQFASAESQQRHRAPGSTKSVKDRTRRAAAVDEAGWLLGVGMALRIVPGAEGQAAAVLAGDPQTIADAASRMRQDIWTCELDRPGDLVIASLLGHPHEQTWDNLAAAVRAAGRVLAEGGAIAVCSELADLPSGSLDRLREAVDFEEVRQDLARDAPPDARRAITLAAALDRGPVYLLSNLPAEVVESMGITPIESDDELSRLAAGRGHCVLIEEAQRTRPTLARRAEL